MSEYRFPQGEDTVEPSEEKGDLAEAIREYMNGFNMLPPSRSIAKMVLEYLHPTVTTDEEVSALPSGSVVVDAHGYAWQKEVRRWYMAGATGGKDTVAALPATVLQRGQA